MRLSTWSLYAAIVLFAISLFLVSRVFGVAPTCIFPGSIPGCLPNNPRLQGALYAGIGGLLLAIGCVLFEGRGTAARDSNRPATPARLHAMVTLVVLAVALLIASGLLAFVPAPQREYRLVNQDLRAVCETNVSVWRAGTIQAYAGEVVQGGGWIEWYDNRTGDPIGLEGSNAEIQPAGEPLNPGQTSLFSGYLVPRDGAYTVYFFASVCEFTPCVYNYTSIAWLNLTATNASLLPTAQLSCAVLGTGTYAGSLLLTLERRRPSKAP